MKKLFFILCLGLILGCSVKPAPVVEEGYSSISGRLYAERCKEYPMDGACPDMVGMTEMSPQEVKPVMKLEKNSTTMLYGGWKSSEWEKGYSHLPVVDKNGDPILYTSNFSVESRSVLTPGMEYIFWMLWTDQLGKVVGQTRGASTISTAPTISTVLGGDLFADLSSYKQRRIMRVMIFKDLGTYFFLPPLYTTAT